MINRDAWWNQNSRPILKSGLGSVACGDVEAADLAAGAAVANIGDGTITSEKATANLRSRSTTLFVDKKTASSSEGWTSAYAVWRPLVPINVLRVQHFTLSNYENATCDNYTVYAGASCISDVALKTVSTGIAAGTRTAGSAVVNAAVLACTDFTVKLNGSTCSASGRVAIQIDFESTG